jgi:hypothetical protein
VEVHNDRAGRPVVDRRALRVNRDLQPLGYLTRPYIVYRSREALPARRGWERVG